MALKNLFTEQQCKNRHREYTYGHGKRGGEGEMYGQSNMETYITTCKIDSQMGIWCMAQETQTGALCQLGEWDGGGGERGYVCTYGWFMLRFGRKQHNSVKPLSFNKKNFLMSNTIYLLLLANL